MSYQPQDVIPLTIPFKHLALILLLLQPALILVDSGHFQYNSVMLGFTLLCLNYLSSSSDLTAALFFVLSLGFKQMSLYYAPAIGSYYLGKCILLGPIEGYVVGSFFLFVNDKVNML